MAINILAFGIAKEIIGHSAITVSEADGISVGDLQSLLQDRYPALTRLSSLAIAVNGEYAAAETMIHAGDELAIIPPVSGG